MIISSGPREFREKYYGRLPTLEEYKDYLRMKLEEAEEGYWDSQCDFQFAMGRLQDYVNSWPPIFNEFGGI